MNKRVWFGDWAAEISVLGQYRFRHLKYHQNMEAVSISIGLHFISLWLTRHTFKAERQDRALEFSHFDGSFHWKVWVPEAEWRSDTPWWRRGWFNPADFVLGQMVHSEETLSTETATVEMAEKAYPATIRLFISTWTRSRFPFIKKQRRRADIEVNAANGIPIPGKGENSWDIDDDAVFSLTCTASSAQDAIKALIDSVNRSRQRYGGDGWMPE